MIAMVETIDMQISELELGVVRHIRVVEKGEMTIDDEGMPGGAIESIGPMEMAEAGKVTVIGNGIEMIVGMEGIRIDSPEITQ
jgi:hypothetical protein